MGKKKFVLYTDGSCRPNPGRGAWSYVIKSASDGKIFGRDSGCDGSTTNNRMELTAVLRGLGRIPVGSSVELVSDSQYVVFGLTKWRFAWKQSKWVGVLNDDLWRQLDALVETFDFTGLWIRGHDGHPENEECDRMCGEALKRAV